MYGSTPPPPGVFQMRPMQSMHSTSSNMTLMKTDMDIWRLKKRGFWLFFDCFHQQIKVAEDFLEWQQSFAKFLVITRDGNDTYPLCLLFKVIVMIEHVSVVMIVGPEFSAVLTIAFVNYKPQHQYKTFSLNCEYEVREVVWTSPWFKLMGIKIVPRKGICTAMDCIKNQFLYQK